MAYIEPSFIEQRQMQSKHKPPLFICLQFTIRSEKLQQKATKAVKTTPVVHSACIYVHKSPRVEERDRLMSRGISLEDVLFPHCVPGAEGS